MASLLILNLLSEFEKVTVIKLINLNNFHFFLKNFLLFKVNLSSDPDDRLKIYKENFEKAYIESLIEFYNKHAQQYITANGIISYLTYADNKLKEEEKRALKYLETGKGSNSLELHQQACIDVLVSKYQAHMFAECNNLIQNNDIKSKIENEKLNWNLKF